MDLGKREPVLINWGMGIKQMVGRRGCPCISLAEVSGILPGIWQTWVLVGI